MNQNNYAVSQTNTKLSKIETPVMDQMFDLSMTSREIAELTGKLHKNVMADVRTLIDKEVINGLNFQLNEYQVKVGFGYRTEQEHILDFDATMVLVTGYDAHRRAAVVKRWRELEQGIATPAFQIPQTYSEALLLAGQLAEENEKIQEENEELRRTKAYINSNRAATAMATASTEKRRRLKAEANCEKLEVQLGYSTDFKAAKSITWLKDFFKLAIGKRRNPGAWTVIGKQITTLAKEMGIPPIKIEDSVYGEVNAYHLDVIAEFKRMLLTDPTYCPNYRR